MNIGITGASGLIGRRLADLALQRGHEVIAFSRTPERAIPGCTMRPFSLTTAPNFTGCEAVVHLAGESVLGLWTASKKERIARSRIDGTRRVVEALSTMSQLPEVLVSGSAVGYYGNGGERELTEEAPSGTGFLAETSRQWESEAMKAREAGVGRVALVRTGVVLAREGGALPLMARVFRLGLGGKLGSGTQWMPWIHLDDLCRLFLFCVENQSVSGPVNGTAPWPVRNAAFTKALALQLRRPAFFTVPAFALSWLGEFSHELLDSKRVLPGIATEHGFPFCYPEVKGALAHLLPS